MTRPLAEEVLAVAIGLWGEPTQRRGRNVRFGKKGSKSLVLDDEPVWYDHETGQGGGWIDLYKLAKHPLPNGGAADSTQQAILYDYRDEDRRLLFQVVRLPGHNFLQRRPDGTNGWVYKLGDVRRVLYRLHELATADRSDPVLVCEGEKDADALARLGLVATTNPGGASEGKSKWRPEFSESLRGRKCVLLPDLDKVGRAHMATVARALEGIAASVHVIELPDLSGAKDDKDVSDWLAKGHTAEELAALWLERLNGEASAPDRHDGLAQELATSTWLARDIPPVDRLLGDLITTTTRAFLVGPSGLGKTMLGLGFAMGMGFGTGFLHWRASRPARVLYIDGEMPTELLVQRLRDAARRIDREDCLDNIMVFSLEDAEALAERWPMLGMCQPLNTEEGQDFIKRLVAATKPDVVIFDNVQALVAGVQKEEETWTPVLPLVLWLTKKRVGQLWIDHTNRLGGHYGTSTKSWRFDAVGLMTELEEGADGARDPREVAFQLRFDKARRRTPENWNEFAPQIIRLRDDVWTSEPAEKRHCPLGKVPPSRVRFFNALETAIRDHGGIRVDKKWWEAAAQRADLIDPPPAKETSGQRRIRLRDFRKAKSDLITAEWIAIDGDSVVNLRGGLR
jgi:hypothetical protein